jgi:asparagine synthetase B (glutamine-hydrolysing)
MEPSIERKLSNPAEPEIEAGVSEKYGELFERIKGTDILPIKGSEWSLENLEQEMNRVFFEYGKKALEENEGKIYMTLSGGLDSTLSLALLRKNFPTEEIITFSMGGNQNHPDILHARLAAEKFASNHYEFIPDENEIQNTLAEYKTNFPEKDLEKAVKTGDLDVYLLYKNISKFKPKVLLAHDGIDELMGGYWDHRKDNSESEKEKIFADFWNKLIPDHLVPLAKTSDNFKIDLLFPYLDERVIKTISNISLSDRTSIESSKKLLREIATTMGVPTEILTRPKRGQVGMLDIE